MTHRKYFGDFNADTTDGKNAKDAFWEVLDWMYLGSGDNTYMINGTFNSSWRTDCWYVKSLKKSILKVRVGLVHLILG